MSAAPVFLVSTGRTGTLFFCQFFARYGEGVVSYHCPSGTRLIHVLANAYEQGLLPAAAMRRLWSGLRERRIRRNDGRYVECNAYYYNLVDTIRASFPDAQFIFVIRSPKGFIRSYVDWERFQWKSTIASRLIPLWQPVSYLDQLRGWRNDYHQRVEFYAKVWARKNASVLSNAVDPSCLRVLRYEDVFDQNKGPQLLRELLAWLDIRATEPIGPEALTVRVNLSRGKRKEEWDERCDDIVRQHCGALMEKYGYAL